MAGCLAARTANHRSNEPPPSFAWGDPLHAIAPVRTLFIRRCILLRLANFHPPRFARRVDRSEQTESEAHKIVREGRSVWDAERTLNVAPPCSGVDGLDS